MMSIATKRETSSGYPVNQVDMDGQGDGIWNDGLLEVSLPDRIPELSVDEAIHELAEVLRRYATTRDR